MASQISAFTDENVLPATAIKVLDSISLTFSNKPWLRSQTIAVKPIQNLSQVELLQCVSLVASNLGPYYQKRHGANWQLEKIEEMQEEGLVYVLIRDESASEKLSLFVSLLCCVEESQLVVYVYEIQLRPELRGRQLGTSLMNSLLCEVIPQLNQLFKVKFEGLMLTCFNDNKRLLKFYKSNGFKLLEHSPKDRKLRSGKVIEPDYYILERRIDE